MAGKPLRRIEAATPRVAPDGGMVWGITLECGHYVELAKLPKARARCDDCANGAPVTAADIVPCSVCPAGWDTTKNGVKVPPPGWDGDVEVKDCPACYGFGFVESHPQCIMEIVAEGPPGSALGDYILGLWGLRLEDRVAVSVVAKRGRRWLGERRSATVDEMVSSMAIHRTRFYPPSNWSQEMVAGSIDNSIGEHANSRSVRINLRTTNPARVTAMEAVIVGHLLRGFGCGV